MIAQRVVRSMVVIGLAAMASSCMTATPYQPYRGETASGIHGGYSEERMAADRYMVRFHGNELTSRDRVEGYMLYRAAELTTAAGYDWFMIVDRHTEHDTRTIVEPDPFYRPYYGRDYGYWRPHWRFYRPGFGWDVWHPEYGQQFWADRIDVRTVESFEAEAEIVMRRAPVVEGEVRAFDARSIIANLGPTIERPKN